MADSIQQDAVVRGPEPTIFKARAGKLHELATDFVLFTPALLHTYGQLQHDPVAEFVARHEDSSCDVARRDYDRQLFSGIPAGRNGEPWNYRIYLIERRFWDDFQRFLAGVALRDIATQFYAEIKIHLAPLPQERSDYRTYASVLSLSSNRNRVVLRKRQNISLASPLQLPADPAVVRRAQAVFDCGAEAFLPRGRRE